MAKSFWKSIGGIICRPGRQHSADKQYRISQGARIPAVLLREIEQTPASELPELLKRVDLGGRTLHIVEKSRPEWPIKQSKFIWPEVTISPQLDARSVAAMDAMLSYRNLTYDRQIALAHIDNWSEGPDDPCGIVYRISRLYDCGKRCVIIGSNPADHSFLLDDLSFQYGRLARAAISSNNVATHDPMTGLDSRYYMNKVLDEITWRCTRDTEAGQPGSPYALIMIDIDGFKSINDNYGHEAGNQVLKQFGGLLRQIASPTISVARWGNGDEFLVALQGCDIKAAIACAEKLRSKASENPFVIDINGHPQRIPYTLSLGAVAYDPSMENDLSLKAMLEKADEALLAVKGKGRGENPERGNNVAYWDKDNSLQLSKQNHRPENMLHGQAIEPVPTA